MQIVVTITIADAAKPLPTSDITSFQGWPSPILALGFAVDLKVRFSGLGRSPSADQLSGEAASVNLQNGHILTGYQWYRSNPWGPPNLHPTEAMSHTWCHDCPVGPDVPAVLARL